MLKRIWRDFDWILFGSTMALVLIGIITIGSATATNWKDFFNSSFVIKQAGFFVLNLAMFFGLQWFDYRRLQTLAKPIYIFTILLLLAVMFVGTSALGAQRWIQIGPITIQPSEFSKLFMIIALANMLKSRINKLNTLKSLIPIAIFMGVPFLLVFKQPDLGTSLVFTAITAGMVFVAGVRLKLVGKIVASILAVLPLGWFILKEYQKQRIRVFLNPDADPFGAGYHIIQSKIAIGSGQLFGHGLFHGSQSQLNFLPENHTDFIFAVIGEEWGFIGCVLVLLLFFAVLYRAIKIAQNINDDFGRLLAVGCLSMICFQVLVNVGMTTGSMPVTGIPLPFISYGVSSLTTNMMCIALLENICLYNRKMMF